MDPFPYGLRVIDYDREETNEFVVKVDLFGKCYFMKCF